MCAAEGGIVLSLFLFIIGVAVVVYFLVRHSAEHRGETLQPMGDQFLEQRNYEWAQFIAQYYSQAQTDAERQLIQRMLADIAARGLPIPTVNVGPLPSQALGAPTKYAQPPAQSTVSSTEGWDEQSHPKQKIDNTSLLLYFGAFLFVASAGLFVGFSEVPGIVRTLVVLIVSYVLYANGIWLFDKKVALRQAAFAFVGIGMTIAPLTGLAAYNYVFDQSYGPAIWFATTLICMVMYGHALIRIREPLLGYIFIFTFLSLFESGVSLSSAPLYYYGWGMALVGIILSIYSRYRKSFLELREPSRASAAFFIPIALFVSLVMAATHGVGQLGVSLLVAAVYYLLETVSVSDKNAQRFFAVVTQVVGLSGVLVLAYAATNDLAQTALVMLAVGMLETVAFVFLSPASRVLANAATVAIAFQCIAALMSLADPAALLLTLSGVVVMALVSAWRQTRSDAYAVGMFSLMFLPMVYGFAFTNPALAILNVVGLLLVALAAQLVMYLYLIRRFQSIGWKAALYLTYVSSGVMPALLSLGTSAWWCQAVCVLVSLSIVSVAVYQKSKIIMVTGGIFVLVPLLLGAQSPFVPGAFLAATLFALAVNIGGALWFKSETSRWISTILWLLLPVAIGTGATGTEWGIAGFAWAYVVAMVGLMLSRAIARGAVLISGKAVMSSFTATASVSYVVGYVLAGALALILSLATDSAQVHASLVLAFLGLSFYVLSEYIEKRADLLVLLPVTAQILLWSVLRPTDSIEGMLPFLLMSTALAVAGYFGLRGFVSEKKQAYLQAGSLVGVFVSPVSRFLTEKTYWPMPVGLLVASSLLYDRVRLTAQANRELVGGLGLLAVYWLMYFWGVREFQAYVHLLVVLLGAYAYWRNSRGEREQSDQYLWAALLTSTIPLVTQAISGESGGVYGWWLLLEMVAWMLIGMAIGRRFVTMWGLYVSVAAVLYQLRGLGWAALTFLATFLIGLAIYQIQRREKNDAQK